MAINYVRFQRGTLAAYQALLDRGLIDENTLYFIYADDASTGSLYMGEKVISGGDTNYIFSTLDELSDVEVTNAESNSFLVKDSATNNWVAKTPAQVAELIQEHININTDITSLIGDNLSIDVIDNVIQLKNYGSNYYAYVPATKDASGNIIEESKYVLTEGFKSGLEPRVEETENGLIISWYEPNSENIENLNSIINNIKNSITDINGEITEVEEFLNHLNNKIGSASTENDLATGLYKELEDLLSLVKTKADASNVYTKNEIDIAIAEAISASNHLQRKIVSSIYDIDISASNAHLFIYMVPTGLQLEDDKYDEYIVIDGTLEKVGSWEVDLTDYATKNSIIELQDALANKVDAIENYTLLSPEDKAKLDKLVIDKDNNLEISGSVNADNVVGLETWLNENADSIKGLSENNLTDDLYEKLSNLLFISSVEETELKVDNGNLSILNIDQDKITGLVDALNEKASKESVEETKTLIKEITDGLAYYATLEQHNADIQELRDILIWKEM